MGVGRANAIFKLGLSIHVVSKALNDKPLQRELDLDFSLRLADNDDLCFRRIIAFTANIFILDFISTITCFTTRVTLRGLNLNCG